MADYDAVIIGSGNNGLACALYFWVFEAARLIASHTRADVAGICMKYQSSYYAPRYDAGSERRRLLIINTLFNVAARLGCRPFMSTSKYGQDPGSERDIGITIGAAHVHFSIEAAKTKKDDKRECLRWPCWLPPKPPIATA